MYRFFILLVLFVLGACKELKPYASGGYGATGNIGNSSTIVTISGRVMSNTTFNAANGTFFGLSSDGFVEHQPVLDACANSSWALSYVGGGTSVISSGTSDSNGDFEVPSVPSGKEGVITFNCSGSTQKCLVKAGDAGLSCNAIADGVVGALESTFGKALTSSDFSGKTVAKVATSIVESTNSDTAEADALKNAMTTCKAMAEGTAKKTCYKNSLEASSQSTTLQMVKTLAQGWSVRALFNFVANTAGYKIYMDDMVYSDFGKAMDDWFDTDFIAQTRLFLSDVVTNPDYIGGNVANGEQLVKIDCKVFYNKYQSWGYSSFKPVLKNVGGLMVPHCYNEEALKAIMGIDPAVVTDPRLTAMAAGINSGNHDQFYIQVGFPGDIDGDGAYTSLGESYVDFDADNDGDPNTGVEQNCTNDGSQSFNVKGYFCVSGPEMVITAKVKEPNRNDVAGERFSEEEEASASMIEVFEGADDKLMAMDATANNPASPYFNCVDMSSDQPIVDLSRLVCRTWLQQNMTPLRKEFSGLIGIYMYLKDPSSYGTSSTSKLSLDDIHRLFSKKTFYNGKLQAETRGQYGWRQTDAGFGIKPILDVRLTTKAVIPEIFNYANSGGPDITATELDTINSNGSLLGRYDLTFKAFETIPTTTSLQALVQNSAHHESWNPWGSKFTNVPGKKIIVSGTPVIFPIYCRMLDRNKKDASNNLMPMEKELNPSTKIECLSDPAAAGVTATATEGLFTVPTGFTYPYVLQFRGYNGDAKGGLYTLADRKTGQTIRVANGEIYILQGHNGNDNTIMVGTDTCPANVSTSSTGSAPLVKAQVWYGWGDTAKSEVVNAYCLNMTGILASDNNTRTYFGGELEVTQTNTNTGVVNTWKMGLAGGRLTTDPSLVVKPVCVFFGTDPFEINTGTWQWQLKAAVSGNFTVDSYTDSYSDTFDRITNMASGSDSVDFCANSSIYPGRTQYYLTQVRDETSFDATVPASRDLKPLALFRSSDKVGINGFVITLGALEPKLTNLQMANTAGVAYSQNLSLLNQKHNPKFDPYCDDMNNNGACDCYAGTTAVLRTDPSECSLADTAAEPTMSNPPYWPNDPNAAAIISFFTAYGGKAGADLILGNNPATPVNKAYLDGQSIFLPLEEILICRFLKDGETTYRRPARFVWDDFSNLHFEGCPDSNGDVIAVGLDGGGVPISGGGPVRVVSPKEMKNAFDIAQPKTFLGLMGYALKSQSQGTTISKTAKLFTFDEALALISARRMLPPRNLNVRTEANAQIKDARLILTGARYSDDMDTSVLSAVLKGITKPTQLAQPD